MPNYKIGIRDIECNVPQETIMRADLYQEFIRELNEICKREKCELRVIDECFDPKEFRYIMRLEKIYKGEM